MSIWKLIILQQKTKHECIVVTTQLNNRNCSYASKLDVSIRIIDPSKVPSSPLPSPQHSKVAPPLHNLRTPKVA
jgi:hypothetical protein